MKNRPEPMLASHRGIAGAILLVPWMLCVSSPCQGSETEGALQPLGVERIDRRIRPNRLTKEKIETLELDRKAAYAAARKKRMEAIVSEKKEADEEARLTEKARKRRVATLQ